MFPLVVSEGVLTVDEDMDEVWCLKDEDPTHPILDAVGKKVDHLSPRKSRANSTRGTAQRRLRGVTASGKRAVRLTSSRTRSSDGVILPVVDPHAEVFPFLLRIQQHFEDPVEIHPHGPAGEGRFVPDQFDGPFDVGDKNVPQGVQISTEMGRRGSCRAISS